MYVARLLHALNVIRYTCVYIRPRRVAWRTTDLEVWAPWVRVPENPNVEHIFRVFLNIPQSRRRYFCADPRNKFPKHRDVHRCGVLNIGHREEIREPGMNLVVLVVSKCRPRVSKQFICGGSPEERRRIQACWNRSNMVTNLSMRGAKMNRILPSPCRSLVLPADSRRILKLLSSTFALCLVFAADVGQWTKWQRQAICPCAPDTSWREAPDTMATL